MPLYRPLDRLEQLANLALPVAPGDGAVLRYDANANTWVAVSALTARAAAVTVNGTLTATGALTASGTVLMAGQGAVGGPALAGTQWAVRGAPNNSGSAIYASGGTGVNALGLFQADASHNATRVNLNNQWLLGNDITAVASRDFYLYDNVVGCLNPVRLFVKGDGNYDPRLGLGTANPDACIQVFTTQTLSGDVPHHLFHGGYSSITNRQISLTQIVGATVRNYIMVGGAASGSSSAPVLVSPFGSSFGIEGTDSSLALVTAAAGNGITPIQGLLMTNTGAITLAAGLYAPAAVSFGALTANSLSSSGSANLRGLINLGTTVVPGLTANSLTVTGTALIQGASMLGDVTAAVTKCNSLTVTGATALAATTAAGFANSGTYGGNGTACTLARSSITLPDATDYTLSATERASVIIDVQNTAGASGATNIIVPSSAGGFYIVINRTSFAMTLKTAGNTGIAVASQRTALLCFPGGTTGFRLTPDTVYTS